MSHVAFLGTGLLGSGMVENLLRRGHSVTAWNRTEEKARRLEAFGARVAASPEDAVAGADRVHMTLPDDDVVEALVARVAPRLKSGAIVVDHSTTLPARTKVRLPLAAEQGIRFLHAPVFMSPQACREAAGVMLVAGPTAEYEAMAPALAEMTGHVWYLGERPDLAAAYKLFGNAMLFTLAGGLSDVFAVAKGAGVAPADAVTLFEHFQPGGMLLARGPKMAAGDFTASFELTMARKDLRLMLETAGGQPLVVLPGLATRMDQAIAEGHGADDLGVIAAAVIRER